jgi:uncharacterized protein YbaR (Trm112 family)
MKDPLAALQQAKRILQEGSPFILEYANKLNLKAILRYWLGQQDWTPFSLDPIEFTELNFDFHPQMIRHILREAGFELKRQLTVSHFRINFLKRTFPTWLLAGVDGLLQPTGALWQLTPSVFTRNIAMQTGAPAPRKGFFQCPACGTAISDHEDEVPQLECTSCGKIYPIVDGIYDFR